ncbi:MAG: thioredoxin family protein [Dehalococcoidia bacterium]
MVQQSVISDQDKAQLKRTLRKDLKASVTLRLFTRKPTALTIPGRECPYCPQTQQLVEELAALSPKLNLETYDFYDQPEEARQQGVARIPAILLGTESPPRVKFYGIPLGYLMASLIEDIKTISRGVSPLRTDSRRKLRQLNQPVHLQVLVTPNDVPSAGMARLAHALAIESPQVSADVIEVQEFPALSQQYAARSVPLTIINEYVRLPGPVAEPDLVDKILEIGVRSG